MDRSTSVDDDSHILPLMLLKDCNWLPRWETVTVYFYRRMSAMLITALPSSYDDWNDQKNETDPALTPTACQENASTRLKDVRGHKGRTKSLFSINNLVRLEMIITES